MSSIKLSPTRGLDPIISQCFLCGRDKGEIILAGEKGNKIRECAGVDYNSNKICFDKDPCDECKKLMDIGVIFISVKDGENKENPYITGGFCAIKNEAAIKLVGEENFNKSKVFFIEDSAYDKIGLPREELVKSLGK